MIPHGQKMNININMGSLRSSNRSERFEGEGEPKLATERGIQLQDDSIQRVELTDN